jgi:hypothetical protein
VKEELDKIEQQRLRNQVRNETLLRKVRDTIDHNQQNEALYRAKETLEEAKRQFLRDLNKRDPLWREKMRTRKLEEIRRLEIQRERVSKEIVERQKMLENDMVVN